MKKSVILLITVFALLFSCKKESEIVDITKECEFHDNILTNCFYGSSDSQYDEYVFRNLETYEEFGDDVRLQFPNVDCDTAKLKTIDFDNYTLLTTKTSGGGCNANYTRTILKDAENNKIIYEISVEYEGVCAMLIGSRNWAIIPKISDNYNVEFVVKDGN